MIAPFPKDDRLPGFPSVLDPDVMANRFDAQMNGRGKLEHCRIERFRYRPGERAIVQYDLGMRDDCGTLQQVWATGTLWRGGKAARLAREISGTDAFYEPNTDMLLQLFPYDRHLPEITDTIYALRRPGSGLLGSDDERAIDIDVVRFRPGIGATLRVHTAQGETVFVKVCRAGSAEQRFDGLLALETASRKNASGFSVCHPLGYSVSLKAIGLSAARGQSLEDYLLRDETNLVEVASRTADAMLSLHGCDVSTGSFRRSSGFANRARRQAQFLRWALPVAAPEIDDLLDRIELELTEPAMRPAHLDMKADHLFLSAEEATFIDLDSFAGSDPVFDPAMLAARIDAMPHLTPLSVSRAEEFRCAMLDAYFTDAPSEFSRFGINYACASLKVALFFLQHLEPNWPDRVSECLARARSALDARDGAIS